MEVNDLLQEYYLDMIRKRKCIKGLFQNDFKLLLLSIQFQISKKKLPSKFLFKEFSQIVESIFRYEYVENESMKEALINIFQIFSLTSHHYQSITEEFPLPLAFGMPIIKCIYYDIKILPIFLDLALTVFKNCSKTFTNPRSAYQLDWAPAVGQLAFFCLKRQYETPYYDQLLDLFIANPNFVNFDDIDVNIFTAFLALHEMDLVTEKEYLRNISRLDPGWNSHAVKSYSIIRILSQQKQPYFLAFLTDMKPLWRITVLLRYSGVHHTLIDQYFKKSDKILVRKRDIFALKQFSTVYFVQKQQKNSDTTHN